MLLHSHSICDFTALYTVKLISEIDCEYPGDGEDVELIWADHRVLIYLCPEGMFDNITKEALTTLQCSDNFEWSAEPPICIGELVIILGHI